jgi:hypothetical protein
MRGGVTNAGARGNFASVLRWVWASLFLMVGFMASRVALADGDAASLREGMALRGRKPPDEAAARAAFERAASSSEAEVAASGLYFLGEMDEEAMRFADAVAHYDASMERLPSSRYAQRAAARSSTLKGHGEGDFAPLVQLETVRRDPVKASDPAALLALTEEAARFPPGAVRVEARLLAAEAYRGRLYRPDLQIPLLWLVVRDPHADVIATREAAVEIIDAEVALGNLDAARSAQLELGTKLDAVHIGKVTRLLRRRTANVFAEAVLFAVVILFGVALARRGVGPAARSVLAVLPMALLFSVFAGGAGGILASSYETGNAKPFLMMVPAMLVAILVARGWSAVGSSAVSARLLRAVLCSSSLFALALFLLEGLTPQYLEGFGL